MGKKGQLTFGEGAPAPHAPPEVYCFVPIYSNDYRWYFRHRYFRAQTREDDWKRFQYSVKIEKRL